MALIDILVVEDELSHAVLIKRSLETRGTASVRIVESLEQCRESLDRNAPDIVLLDMHLPDGQALDLLKERSAQAIFPTLIMTSQGSEELAVEAMKSGALDYIVKSPETINDMPRIVERALREWRTRQQHKDAERALRDSEARYRHLFQEFNGLLDAVPDSFMLIDRQLRILWANRAASQDAASPPQSPVGRYCFQLWYQRNEPCERCQGKRAFDTGESCSDIITLPDGRIVDCRAVPLRDTDGTINKVINVKRDITEQRRLEVEADRAGRLAVLGELSAGLAHEINNPNALILYNSEMLEQIFSDLLPRLSSPASLSGEGTFGGLSFAEAATEIPQLMAAIHDAAKRIRRIVNDLRDFSRQDKQDPLEPLDINRVVKMSMRLVANAINKATDRFTMDLGENLPLVKGVQGRLEQVIINLLINACQSLDDRSCGIHVRTTVTPDASQLQVIISDEGQGIPDKVRDRLFEPFVTTKRTQGGTGLGLSVSARIIKEHNGTINFTSTPGQGTVATVTLPVVTESADDKTRTLS